MKGKELVTRGIVIRRVIAVVKKGKVKYRIQYGPNLVYIIPVLDPSIFSLS